MDKEADVLRELFGNFELARLTVALEPEFNDLLLCLREPLGYQRFTAIRRAPRPAEALVNMLYEHGGDKDLMEAFRNYVLRSDGLHYVLTPEAKAASKEMKSKETPDPPLIIYSRTAEHHASEANIIQDLSFSRVSKDFGGIPQSNQVVLARAHLGIRVTLSCLANS